MVHKIIGFVHFVIAVFSVLLALGFMSASDEIVLQGADMNLTVGGDVQNVDMRAASAFIQSAALEHQGNIARLVPDLRNPTSHRNLYLAVGASSASSASWIEKGYPDFTRSMTTTVQPFAKISSLDVRGQYVVFGSSSLEQAVITGLQGMGLEVSTASVSPLETFKWFLSTSGLGNSYMVLALIVIVSAGAGVILNARSYAIQRLQGGSYWTSLGRDLIALARFTTPIYAGLAVITLVALYFYNSLHQVAGFAWFAALVAASLSTAALLTHGGVLLLAWRVPLIAAVKGQIPAKSTLGAVYVVKIVASFLAFGIVSATLVLGGQVLGQQESKAVWAANSDLSMLQFKTNLSQEEFMQHGQLFGQAARKADRDGTVVFAQMFPFEALQSYDPNGSVAPVSGPPVVYVNSTYLKRETVLDAQGQRILPSDTVRLLVPNSLKPELEKISETVSFSIGVDRPVKETVLIADDQRINAFSSFDGIQADTSFPNAVVLAVPSGGTWMPDGDYYAYATSGGLLFTDPEDMIARTDQAGASGFVTGFRPAALDASATFQKDAAAFRNHLFSIGAALLVLLVTSLGAALVYTRKNAQRIFVSFIHGWQSWQVNAWLLAVESAAAIALIGYGIALAAKDAAATAAGSTGATSPILRESQPLVQWAPTIALAIALLSVTFTLLALRGYKTSLIRSHSADA